MKNYFTDSQVKEALEKLGMRRPFSSHSLQHYKNLMNLAVEVAIMEDDIEGLNERLAKFDEMNKQKPLNLVLNTTFNWRTNMSDLISSIKRNAKEGE